MMDVRRAAQWLMAACLATMACVVFVNVVLRYGFGSGIAASEELSRLLFVWMVFIGATVAYPAGEHMAFTSLLLPLRKKPRAMAVVSNFIHLAVLLAAAMVAKGAWEQVRLGWDAKSPVMGYPLALLPLPALLCCGAIALMATYKLLKQERVSLGHEAEVE